MKDSEMKILGNKESRLVRRTATVDAAQKKDRNENYFWQQAQSIFASALQKEEYDESFYIDMPLAEGYTQSSEVEKYLEMNSGPRCLLLVGPHGVGKSSIIHHSYKKYIADAVDRWAWIYFDGNEHRTRIEGDVNQLIPALVSVVYDYLPVFLSRMGLTSRDFFLDVFDRDAGLSSERFLNADATEEVRAELARKYIASKESVKLEVALRYFSRSVAPGKAIIVIDNIDPLDAQIQAEIVRQLLGLSVSCRVKGIVAIRKKAEASLSYSNPNLFYQFIRTTVQPPPLVEVIKRRVGFAVQQPDAQNAKLGEGALVFRVRDCPEFEDVLVRGLSSEGTQRVIEGVSNGSVRQALRISLSIYASPHLDPKKIVAKLSPAGSVVRDLWSEAIPNYIAVRSILLRTARLYDEDISWVKNVFGSAYSGGHLGPFLRLHILRFLLRLCESEIKVDSLSEKISDLLYVDVEIVMKEIRWLARWDWIEFPPSGLIFITRLGRFIAEEFVSNREYLACISTDVDMSSDLERRLVTDPLGFREYSQNMCVLLEYLARREARMLQYLSRDGLRDYSAIFGVLGFSVEIASKVLNNLRRLRPEDAVDAVIEDLHGILRSDAIRKIQEILRRYGGEAYEASKS